MRTFESLSLLETSGHSPIDPNALSIWLSVKYCPPGRKKKGTKEDILPDWARVCAAGTRSLFGSHRIPSHIMGGVGVLAPNFTLTARSPFCRDS